MNRDYAVLIVEESPHEAAVITSAIRLHDARLDVRTVQNPQGAFEYLHDAASATTHRLVILGARAIAQAAELLPRMNGAASRHAVVGIAPEVATTVRDRALDVGVLQIHQRPATWAEYRDLVRGILQSWLEARRP
jgi:hypothetical protein